MELVVSYFSLSYLIASIVMFVGVVVPLGYIVVKNKKSFKNWRTRE
jgi:hypothetical protein